MMDRKSLGKIGERAAANYLCCQGYVIRERNWRYKRAEIDLICSKHQLLVFIEVKSRYCFKPGCSEFEVSREQMGRISWAAQRYMESAEHRWSVRFDLICVEVLNHREYQVNHYEDAFFPGLESTFY